MKTQSASRFFFEHAGYSYDPKKETKLQGRWRCATALALAERKANDAGLSFEWPVDPDSNFSEEKPAWSLWQCLARGQDNEVVASLGGIDFGRRGEPWGDPYERVGR